MKSLAAAALLLFTAAPGLAQPPAQTPLPAPKNCAELLARMPSDGLWTRVETRQDADALATALHKKLDLNHDGYVTLDEVKQVAKQATGATGELPPDGEAFVRRVSCRAIVIMMAGCPWPKKWQVPMPPSLQWTRT